jgi:hypothetical protein
MHSQIAIIDTDLHDLQRLIHVAREGTKSISVPKEALRRLLLDHYTLYQALRDRKLLTVIADPDQRSLL